MSRGLPSLAGGRGRRSAALFAALAATPLPAQDPAGRQPVQAEPPTATALLSRLAARDTTLAAAQQLCEQLQERPLAIRLQRFDVVHRKYGEQLRSLAKAEERLLRAFAKAVPKAQRTRLGRTGEAKVAALREQARAITQAPDLTKERIHAELDPLLEQLRDLVLPTMDRACAEDPWLAEALPALRRQFDDVRGWSELSLTVMHDLDRDPGGRRHVDQVHLEPDPPAPSTLDDELDLLLLSALPLGGRDEKALAANATQRASLDAEEYRGTFELNRIRVALGLPVLLVDEKLGNAARDHSQDMQKLGFFSHESPVAGKRTPGDRAARAGTSGGAENIAAGQDSGAGAIRAWWYSPGHHKNMLGGHGRTGLGRCAQLWTQMFGS